MGGAVDVCGCERVPDRVFGEAVGGEPFPCPLMQPRHPVGAIGAQARMQYVGEGGRQAADTTEGLTQASRPPRPGALDERDPADRSRPGPALPTRNPTNDGNTPGGLR